MNKVLLIVLVLFVTSCNVIKMVKDDSGVPDDFLAGADLFLNVNFAPASRDFYTVGDTVFRELNFDYPWDSQLFCSNDGGVTFNDCGQSTTYVWNHADYNVNHVFKVVRGDEEYSVNFNPSVEFPGVTFGSCTHTFNVSDSMQNTFGAITIAANDVICISDGVEISNDGDDGAITLNTSNIKIVANLGDYAAIKNNVESSVAVIDTSGMADSKLYGLTIVSDVNSNAVKLSGANSAIWDCSVQANHVAALSAVRVDNTGANGPVSINGSNLFVANNTSGSSLYVTNVNFFLNDSVVYGGYMGIFMFYNGGSNLSLSLEDSIVESGRTTYAGEHLGTISIGNTSASTLTVNLSNVDVESRGGPAILFEDATSGNINLNLLNSKLVRLSDSNIDSTAIKNIDTTDTITVTADANSLICNNSNSSGSMFTTIWTDVGTTLTFDETTMDAHTSNTDVNLCL